MDERTEALRKLAYVSKRWAGYGPKDAYLPRVKELCFCPCCVPAPPAEPPAAAPCEAGVFFRSHFGAPEGSEAQHDPAFSAAIWVTDGVRTRDIWSHNPVLYQLSYGHRVQMQRPNIPTPARVSSASHEPGTKGAATPESSAKSSTHTLHEREAGPPSGPPLATLGHAG